MSSTKPAGAARRRGQSGQSRKPSRRANGHRDERTPGPRGAAKVDSTRAEELDKRQADLDQREAELDQRETDLEQRDADLSSSSRVLEVERAAVRGERKVVNKRSAELRLQETRSRKREKELVAAREEAERQAAKMGDKNSTRLGRLVVIVVPVIALAFTCVNTAIQNDSDEQQQQAFDSDQAARMAELGVEYLVLPPPSDIRENETPINAVEPVEDYYANDGRNSYLTSDHRYYTNEALSYDDLIPGETIRCWSPTCEQVVRREASARFETVYLKLENIGPTVATSVEITLQPYSPDPAESEHFDGVFHAPQGDETFTIDENYLHDLEQGEALLVPVAAVAVFEPEGGRTYVGMRDARRPTRACWRNGIHGQRECRPIRDIHSGHVLISGEVPSGG